jgi:hypothetical protein
VPSGSSRRFWYINRTADLPGCSLSELTAGFSRGGAP